MRGFNLGYTFYRNNDRAEDVDFGREIVNRAEHLKVDASEYFEIEHSEKLVYSTVYPSLTLGLGYAHDTSEKDDYKLGFMFDHTTGLPYIPGSTLKGVLRSMFPFDEEDRERLDFINDLLGESYSYEKLYEIEKSIFGKKPKDSDTKDDAQSKDIFYDGYFETMEGGFLASDNLTPHKDEITSPIPLRFLKIAPETKLVLQFELKENEKIGKTERMELYRGILSWTGLGAKTNVGYGQLEEYDEEKSKILKQQAIEEQKEKKRKEEEKKAKAKAFRKTHSPFRKIQRVKKADRKD